MKVFYIYNNFRQLVRDDVGPYLSLKINEFSTTPSQELQRYWSDKSLDELTEKLNEYKSSPLFREVLDKKKLLFDKLLSACQALVKWARSNAERTRSNTTS